MKLICLSTNQEIRKGDYVTNTVTGKEGVLMETLPNKDGGRILVMMNQANDSLEFMPCAINAKFAS